MLESTPYFVGWGTLATFLIVVLPPVPRLPGAGA